MGLWLVRNAPILPFFALSLIFSAELLSCTLIGHQTVVVPSQCCGVLFIGHLSIDPLAKACKASCQILRKQRYTYETVRVDL